MLSSKWSFILAHDLRGLIPKTHPNLYLSKKHGREIIVYRILPEKITDGRPFPRPPNYTATYLIYEPLQCGMHDQQSLRSACAYAQSDQSLCWSLEYSMIVKILTEHHLEFLILKECCRGSSEPTLVKMSNCSKSHAVAQLWNW